MMAVDEVLAHVGTPGDESWPGRFSWSVYSPHISNLQDRRAVAPMVEAVCSKSSQGGQRGAHDR